MIRVFSINAKLIFNNIGIMGVIQLDQTLCLKYTKKLKKIQKKYKKFTKNHKKNEKKKRF